MLVLFQYNTRGQIATWSTCCFSNSHKVFLSADSHRRVPEGEKMSPCSCQHCYVWRKFSELIGSAFLPNQHAVEISGWLEELCHIAMSPWPWVPVCAGCWVSLDTALEQVEIKVGRGRQVLLTHWWLFGVLWFCLFFFPFFPIIFGPWKHGIQGSKAEQKEFFLCTSLSFASHLYCFTCVPAKAAAISKTNHHLVNSFRELLWESNCSGAWIIQKSNLCNFWPKADL